MHADGKSTLASVSKWNSGKVNYMGKMNSENISRFQVSSLNYITTWTALKIAHRRTCSMFQILFMNQCYPMETESLKFSEAS